MGGARCRSLAPAHSIVHSIVHPTVHSIVHPIVLSIVAALVVMATLAIGTLLLAPRECHASRYGGSDPIAAAYPLIFDSEWIRLSIEGDSLEVRGTYVLLCRGERERPLALFYPFPRDSSMGGARMLSLSVRPGWKAPERPGLWEDLPGTSGARWWVPACEGDTIVLESVYRQRTDAGYARYIVTTTRPWGRPLKRASFEVRLPPGAIPLEWSFPFEPLPGGDAPGGETLYRYEARDFFPDRDIVVRWKP